MPHYAIMSDQPPGSTPRGTMPRGAVRCRIGFARTAEQADAMVRQLRELGCRGVQRVEIGMDEPRTSAGVHRG